MFEIDSTEFQVFHEKFLKPLLLKIQYANDYAQAKFKKRVVISLNILAFLILTQILFSTILANYYDLVYNAYQGLIKTYVNWYRSKSLITRIFIPSTPFFFGFPSIWKLIVLALIILPIFSIAPLLKSKSNQLDIFNSFFQFIDDKVTALYHQKLRYVFVLEEALTLPEHNNLVLENNIEFQLNGQAITLAQIYLNQKVPTSAITKLIFPSYNTIYRGLIVSAKLNFVADRFIKVFIHHNNLINFSSYQELNQSIFLNQNIEKNIKLFASHKDFLLKEEVATEILNKVDLLQQYNFPKPIYLDQAISDKLNHNSSERFINAYSYIELTILETDLLILIPSNHKILGFNSSFATVDSDNDCKFLLATLDLISLLIKRLQR